MSRPRCNPGLPPTFRLIHSEDAHRPFHSSEALGSLKDLVEFAARDGHAVVVKEHEGAIVGVVAVVVDGDVLTIERLGRDLTRGWRGIGAELLLVVEHDLAPRFGARELRLEAMNMALVAFYQRFGFQRSGPPVKDEVWGPLYPMRKVLR